MTLGKAGFTQTPEGRERLRRPRRDVDSAPEGLGQQRAGVASLCWEDVRGGVERERSE